MTQTARQGARELADHRWFRAAARSGFAAIGVVHVLLGYVAVRVAIGGSGAESDQSGALKQLARVPGGVVVLWLTALGLVALCLWLVLSAFLGVGTAKRRWVRTVSDLAKAVGYGVLAGTAIRVVLGAGASSAQSSRSASAKVLAAPGGVFLLVAVGLGILGVGVYFVVKGLRRRFRDEISKAPGGGPRKGIETLGVVGYVAKGVAVGAMGILFVFAAVTNDPSDASGLDGALKRLAGLPFGTVILVAVGVGLACYGVYCFARARYARL